MAYFLASWAAPAVIMPHSGDPTEAYRIYRHHEPITASNLDGATLLVEVPAGSGYYEHEDAEGSPIGQSRFIIEDDGEPLPEGRGLFVYTVHNNVTSERWLSSVAYRNQVSGSLHSPLGLDTSLRSYSAGADGFLAQ